MHFVFCFKRPRRKKIWQSISGTTNDSCGHSLRNTSVGAMNNLGVMFYTLTLIFSFPVHGLKHRVYGGKLHGKSGEKLHGRLANH